MGIRKRRLFLDRHKVAKAHRHKAEKDEEGEVPLSLRRAASAGRRLPEGELIFSEKLNASIDHIRVIKATPLVLDFVQRFFQTQRRPVRPV
jgi:hypothetical protein